MFHNGISLSQAMKTMNLTWNKNHYLQPC
jgi:hypothetical protein